MLLATSAACLAGTFAAVAALIILAVCGVTVPLGVARFLILMLGELTLILSIAAAGRLMFRPGDLSMIWRPPQEQADVD